MARGHRSETFEISRIVGVDFDQLTVTVAQASSHKPRTAYLRGENTPAARQLLAAVESSLVVSENSDKHSGWTSMSTLTAGINTATQLLRRMAAEGLDDFGHPSITVSTLQSLFSAMPGTGQASAAHLLARVLRSERDDGDAIASALKRTRFRVDPARPEVYDDEVVVAIEKCARSMWATHFAGAQRLFKSMGFDVQDGRGRGWLHVPAPDVIDWATDAHPDLVDPGVPEPATDDLLQSAAWAVTHPNAFDRTGSRRAGRRPAMRRVGQLLYPDRVTLCAALILHCLGEHNGYNLSTLQQKNVDTLEWLGEVTAKEHSSKARNGVQDALATSTQSIHSPGGVLEVLMGLTRFSRQARAGLLAPDGGTSPVVGRLYVEHRADPKDSAVIDSGLLSLAWRSPRFDDHWDQAMSLDRASIPLRFSALRYASLSRAMRDGIRADVHGHTERTKTLYLENVLPDRVLHPSAQAAQDRFHLEALLGFEFAEVSLSDDNPASARLAAVPSEDVVDNTVGVCANGGNDPDLPDLPCKRGITACFVCPNGYRTVQHVPALLAVVEFTQVLEDNDVSEWERGDGPALRTYAQASLDRFPPALLESVRRDADYLAIVPEVALMYMELGHG